MRFLNNPKFYFVFLPFYLLVFTFSGCAPAPYVKPAPPRPSTPGIYHRVEKGQTLWRISKTYNADLEKIVQANRISDATNIEIGQLIFIPYAQKPQVITRYSSEDFIWPVRGKVVSGFGQSFNNIINKGINIQPFRSSNVVASRSGRVIFYSDNFGGFGKTLIIEHGEGFSTVYTRIGQALAKVGQAVGKGEPIARTGPILHFEIRKGHIPQNPNYYLAR